MESAPATPSRSLLGVLLALALAIGLVLVWRGRTVPRGARSLNPIRAIHCGSRSRSAKMT